MTTGALMRPPSVGTIRSRGGERTRGPLSLESRLPRAGEPMRCQLSRLRSARPRPVGGMRCHRLGDESSRRWVLSAVGTTPDAVVDDSGRRAPGRGSTRGGPNGAGEPVDESFAPGDFALGPGELSAVDATGLRLPEDEYQGAKDGSDAWRTTANGYLVQILKARVYDVALQTPLEEADMLSEQLGNKLFLKREDLQPVFSFKLRGAYNKMASLSPKDRELGVICSSAGNHAQGVALSARHL
eukprot:evm.model.scf_1274.1 EVM.evm.TU.scf_1274.1   scf_1274:27392-29569(-)